MAKLELPKHIDFHWNARCQLGLFGKSEGSSAGVSIWYFGVFNVYLYWISL